MAVPNQIVSRGFSFEDYKFTYFVSGSPTSADVGKAVSQDTTAASTVKLAADGDTIFGRLETFEDRSVLGVKVGTVARKIKDILPIKSGLTGLNAVAVGDTVVGAGGGEVKALNNGTAKTPNPALNTVVELVTIDSVAYAVVEQL